MAEDKKKKELGNIRLNANSAQGGLNLDSSVSQVGPGKVTYALNAAVENFDDNSVSYQNELGNELCLKFPAGYKLIGQHYIQEKRKHIFFLVNSISEQSEIGFMDNNDCKYQTLVNAPCLNFNIKNTVIIGGYQAHLISDFLVQNNIPVLIQHTHSLPNFEDEDYNSTYLNPKKLIDDGVLVGIHTGSASNFQTRNLPFYAGQVAAQGVDKEIALQLITSNTAKILRIDKTLGTLEAGKNATLFVSKGDALDMKSNQLTSAYISGRKVSLETHQTELWKRYSEKYKLSN